MVPLICGWEYFPNKRGLVTGVCLGGYGFGSFIFSQVSTAIVNPNHEDPIDDPSNEINFYDRKVAMNVPKMIRQLVYMWIFLVIIGIALITRPKFVDVEDDDETDRVGLLDEKPNENLKSADKAKNLKDEINTSETITLSTSTAR